MHLSRIKHFHFWWNLNKLRFKMRKYHFGIKTLKFEKNIINAAYCMLHTNWTYKIPFLTMHHAYNTIISCKCFRRGIHKHHLSEISLVNSCVFLSFQRQEGVFPAFRPEDEVKHSNDPLRVPLKFDGGYFEPIKKLRIFCTGSATSSYYRLLLCYIAYV